MVALKKQKIHQELQEAPANWPGRVGPLEEDHTGDPTRRQAASPNPVRLRRRVTFEDSSPSRDTEVKQAPPPTKSGRQSPEATGSYLQPWSEEPMDLGHPPEWHPLVQEFLSGTGSPDGGDD